MGGTRVQRTRAALGLSLCTVLVVAFVIRAHPHDEPEIFDATGVLTKVDAVNQIIEMDTIDRQTKARRNLLLFVDPKVNIRNGKTRLSLADLRHGQRVRCRVVRRHQEGRDHRERLVVFEIHTMA
jgi:hypothetical protein